MTAEFLIERFVSCSEPQDLPVTRSVKGSACALRTVTRPARAESLSRCFELGTTRDALGGFGVSRTHATRRAAHWLSLIIVLAILQFATGCATLVDPNVPEPIRPFVEPNFETDYLLYRPSSYDRRDAWPLVVVCHGGFPDSPARRIREWTQWAERYGFLIAAPQMQTGGKSTWPRAEQATRRLDENERRILSILRHVQAGQSISTDRIFIDGSGSGGPVALYTGLRNPSLFRAISLRDPAFEEQLLEGLADVLDPYQPILVQHGSADWMMGDKAGSCITWLRSQGFHVRTAGTTSDRMADVQRAVEFYERVVRTEPWMRIVANPDPGGDMMRVTFRLEGTHRPNRFHWDFGDGDSSTVAEPIHRFRSPGTYRVTVTVDGPDKKDQTRVKSISVPLAPVPPIGMAP
jgi:poly(3-hydroxybutyrate) depolymerase